MKEDWKPGTMLYPLPAVLVTCGTWQHSNLLTVAWAGTVCTNPPMLSISVRPERYSHEIICKQMEFTVNLTTEEMARATDWCGVKSGREHDKWLATGLTPEKGVAVECPSIEQSPLSIECRVKEILHLGSHDLFIADVVNVRAEQSLIDPESGVFQLDKAGLIAYSHGHYFALGEELGHFGFSVRKNQKTSHNKPK